MNLAAVALQILLYLPIFASASVFDLSDLNWTLKSKNGSVVVPGRVPSQAHLDLTRAGVITEPLLEINDFTERWVAEENWTYTADLSPFFQTVNTTASGQSQTLLVFWGIDTIANITFAGQPVAWVNNQFRHYIYDVTPLLAAGSGNITLDFESAVWYGLNVSSRPDATFYPGGNGIFEYPAARHYIRKIQIDFGWDWGPAFVPTGIFKPAFLITLSNSTNSSDTTADADPGAPTNSLVFIEESSVDIYKEGSNFTVPPNQSADWVLNVTLGIRSAAATTDAPPSLTLALPELGLTSSPINLPALTGNANETQFVDVQWKVPDAAPKRWYPHNLGTPQLYNLTGTLSFSNAGNVTFTMRTGFRTIRLVQAPVPEADVEGRGVQPGDQWHFEVNGREFYVMGTNLVPFDPFYARTTTEQVRWVLESAVLSGQNMLRVWGGGMYQPSDRTSSGGVYDFYNLCDELGIFAWSEFLFSDALQPINDFMLESIEPEVKQNVRRVNKHPSVAQWAGGNEIEGIAISTNTSLDNGTIYLDQFVFFFQEFLHDLTLEETRSVPYTDCSTNNGLLSLDPYILRLNNKTDGELYGNAERFDYDATHAFDYGTYPVARFVNEFGQVIPSGFHSMPSFYTWQEVLTEPEDYFFNSTVVMSRDHHPPAGGLTFPNPNAPEGQREMTEAVEMWLPRPGDDKSNETFAQWCYSTQVFQALTITSEIAWYRHGAGQPENNLGAIVWQLNDIWQGVSWSSVEYSGRWKVLHYGEVRAFAPVIIHPFWTVSNQSLEVLVISDRWEDVSGSAQLTWYDWEGKVVNTSMHMFTVPSLNNSRILEQQGLETILPEGRNETDVWMLLNFTAEVDGKTVTNENYFTPTSLANATLKDPQIAVTRNDDLTFVLSAKAAVAPWTWIEHPLGTVGHFVDATSGVPSNGFYLIPGIDRTLKFILNPSVSKEQDPNPADFVVRSVWNSTVAPSTESLESESVVAQDLNMTGDSFVGEVQIAVMPP